MVKLKLNNENLQYASILSRRVCELFQAEFINIAINILILGNPKETQNIARISKNVKVQKYLMEFIRF